MAKNVKKQLRRKQQSQKRGKKKQLCLGMNKVETGKRLTRKSAITCTPTVIKISNDSQDAIEIAEELNSNTSISDSTEGEIIEELNLNKSISDSTEGEIIEELNLNKSISDSTEGEIIEEPINVDLLERPVESKSEINIQENIPILDVPNSDNEKLEKGTKSNKKLGTSKNSTHIDEKPGSTFLEPIVRCEISEDVINFDESGNIIVPSNLPIFNQQVKTCELCGATFKRQKTYRCHMLKHEPGGQIECNKVIFVQKPNMNIGFHSLKLYNKFDMEEVLYQNVIKDPIVVIVKIVELHRENLPVNSAHGWSLIPTNCCSLRCWQKDLSLNIVGYPVSVFACAKEVPCAAVILLNVIADVSTWSEWDVEIQNQTIHLELPENSSLHGDPFMQCDQVLITSKLNTKPEIEMYRFGNLERNGTGWILLWNAKRLDWTLYVAQPIENNSEHLEEEEKCLLTVIWGCEPKPSFQNNMPDILCRKVHNLSEAISYSQMKIRPFKSLMLPSSLTNPHFPTIHSALDDLPTKPCVLLEYEKERASFQNAVLALMPLSSQIPMTVNSIIGFNLVLHQLKKSNNSNVLNHETVVSEDKRKSRRRHKVRSDSMNSGFPRNKGKRFFLTDILNLQLEVEGRRSSSLSAPIRKKPPELTITKPEDDEKPPQRSSSHSFLNVLFPRRHSSDSYQRSRSPSPCRSLSPRREKRGFFKSEKRSSLSSQEDLSSRSSFQDFDVSDNEGDQNFLKMANSTQEENIDFKALGEYSISSVLQENLKASYVKIHATEETQKRRSGGWVFKEINRNIAIFKKTLSFESCVFVSYLCKGIIPSPVHIVWKTLCNPVTRFMYDDTVKKITVLSEYPNGQKLIHMYNESVTLLHKEVQDFCILQTEKVQGSKFLLGFHSVKDSICPPVKDIVRGTVVASGWVVEPVKTDTDSCQVSYLVQMVVSSPEATQTMEEISSMQSQCINNLSIYLSAKPPSYLPV
ncbi:START domain-containing protein [Caerostris darwini]|uniref:START domain-containing protein n=1 Tax=Caerostris darwini TaxID=1538125 RepID=A0AAV4RB44_9ARAC|nr:START domain-containing protein [Caerostris darwini]